MACVVQLKVPAGYVSYYVLRGSGKEAAKLLEKTGFTRVAFDPTRVYWEKNGWTATVAPYNSGTGLAERLKGAK